MKRTIYVNEAYRPQRISGQQRYATEISNRLNSGVHRVSPGPFFAGGPIRTWLWVLVVLPFRTWRGVLISLTARAPVWHPRHVLVIHDLFVIEHPEWFSRLFEKTHAPLLRLQIATARCLAAVSQPVANELGPRRRAGTIVVAPNAPSMVFGACSPNSADPADAGEGRDAESFLGKCGLLAGGYLLVVGNQDPRKNLGRLATAYGRLPAEVRDRIPLVVVGGAAEIYRHSTIGWPAGTVVTGYVTDAELNMLYAHCRVVVFPSLAEGFGLPIVEAVVAGAPRLLLSDIPVFRWICGPGAAYVDPTSIDDLAASLQPDRLDSIPPVDPAIGNRFDWSTSAATIAQAAHLVSR